MKNRSIIWRGWVRCHLGVSNAVIEIDSQIGQADGGLGLKSWCGCVHHAASLSLNRVTLLRRPGSVRCIGVKKPSNHVHISLWLEPM